VPTDEEILNDITTEMRWDTRVTPSEFGIAVKDGVVHLTGVVNRQMKRTVARRNSFTWDVPTKKPSGQ
jgi:osmotically-inducible protein OsmY